MRKILFAEDEASIREFTVINLKKNGYEVTEAADGNEAVAAFDAAEGDFDIALLDIMMPGKDGLEVCRYIRSKSSSIGILMLTAKSQESDKVAGLLDGADDYVVKPFSPNELIARLEALYRRVELGRELESKTKKASSRLEYGGFALDLRTRTLEFDGKEAELTQVEFQIVEYFFSNPGAVLSRSDILTAVWGPGYYGEEKVVDVNIRRLRMKIERDPSNPVHLVTVWGSGYKWI